MEERTSSPDSVIGPSPTRPTIRRFLRTPYNALLTMKILRNEDVLRGLDGVPGFLRSVRAIDAKLSHPIMHALTGLRPEVCALLPSEEIDRILELAYTAGVITAEQVMGSVDENTRKKLLTPETIGKIIHARLVATGERIISAEQREQVRTVLLEFIDRLEHEGLFLETSETLTCVGFAPFIRAGDGKLQKALDDAVQFGVKIDGHPGACPFDLFVFMNAFGNPYDFLQMLTVDELAMLLEITVKRASEIELRRYGPSLPPADPTAPPHDELRLDGLG